MSNSQSQFQAPTPGKRGKRVKQASAASVGATILLVIGYLVASWLGIPLDGLIADPAAEGGPAPAVATAPSGQQTTNPPAVAGGSTANSQTDASFQIDNVTVRDLEGRVAFQGTVDLTATMRRIDAGQILNQFRNDGSTFQNREGRLPKKDRGYYKEFVHPTPKLRGPGPQRIVTGKQGEAYYTADHYKTFERIR